MYGQQTHVELAPKAQQPGQKFRLYTRVKNTRTHLISEIVNYNADDNTYLVNGGWWPEDVLRVFPALSIRTE